MDYLLQLMIVPTETSFIIHRKNSLSFFCFCVGKEKIILRRE